MADIVRIMGDACDPEMQEVATESVNYLSSTSVIELISILSDYIEIQILEKTQTRKIHTFSG